MLYKRDLCTPFLLKVQNLPPLGRFAPSPIISPCHMCPLLDFAPPKLKVFRRACSLYPIYFRSIACAQIKVVAMSPHWNYLSSDTKFYIGYNRKFRDNPIWTRSILHNPQIFINGIVHNVQYSFSVFFFFALTLQRQCYVIVQYSFSVFFFHKKPFI